MLLVFIFRGSPCILQDFINIIMNYLQIRNYYLIYSQQLSPPSKFHFVTVKLNMTSTVLTKLEESGNVFVDFQCKGQTFSRIDFCDKDTSFLCAKSH